MGLRETEKQWTTKQQNLNHYSKKVIVLTEAQGGPRETVWEKVFTCRAWGQSWPPLRSIARYKSIARSPMLHCSSVMQHLSCTSTKAPLSRNPWERFWEHRLGATSFLLLHRYWGPGILEAASQKAWVHDTVSTGQRSYLQAGGLGRLPLGLLTNLEAQMTTTLMWHR